MVSAAIFEMPAAVITLWESKYGKQHYGNRVYFAC
jgi:hypothetical protein